MDRARFARHHHQAIARYRIARRAQAIAIKRGGDESPVAEGDARRPVPRLHQARGVFVKAAQVAFHVRRVLVRFGHQHHHRV
jgi:putative component of toxin-antitoxin plasmid stabilization module